MTQRGRGTDNGGGKIPGTVLSAPSGGRTVSKFAQYSIVFRSREDPRLSGREIK